MPNRFISYRDVLVYGQSERERKREPSKSVDCKNLWHFNHVALYGASSHRENASSQDVIQIYFYERVRIFTHSGSSSFALASNVELHSFKVWDDWKSTDGPRASSLLATEGEMICHSSVVASKPSARSYRASSRKSRPHTRAAFKAAAAKNMKFYVL
jgi:hypothetical protein